jgi:RNA-directed DNA polymerase
MSLATPDKLKKLQGSLYASAKQQKERRFHALYDKVYREDILAHAYAVSRSNDGAPGVDGMSFQDVEAYGVEKWLAEIRTELQMEQYHPQPVRRVMIPKEGGTGERPLGIPTVKDRVVQTAAKFVLEPIFEADFDEAAFGYRPGRSGQQAVVQVHEAIRQGHREVVDADLSKYFDTIPHAELIKCLARRISDGKMLRLIKMWLKVSVEEKDDRGNRRMSGGKKSKMGTPQGGVISPLLANIYMNRFIKAFRKFHLDSKYGAVLVNYADDFVVLCRRGATEVAGIIRTWMTRIGLVINEKKTRVCKAKDGFNFLGYTFGQLYSVKTGNAYLGTRPSEKSVTKLKEKVRAVLNKGNQEPWEEVRARLNRVLRGYGNYFSFGTVAKVRHDLDRFVDERVRRFLRRRHKLLGRGTRQFSSDRIFGELGVLKSSSLPRHPAVHARA